MAVYAKINFSNDDIGTDGAKLEWIKENAIKREESRRRSQGLEPLCEDDRDIIRGNIISKRENEKNILIALATVKAKDKKSSLADFSRCLEIVDALKNCDDCIEIEKSELDFILSAWDELPEDIKIKWTHYPELMKQLYNPETIER